MQEREQTAKSPHKVALYARISTIDKGQSVETQLQALREYVDRRGLKDVVEYVDTGISGSKDSRPALDRLMRDTKLRLVNTVIVWRFDRFSRSVSHLMRSLEEFQACGVEFVSLMEAIDTGTPVGKMVFTILGAVAEMERNMIRERVIAGMARARKEGKVIGGRKARLFDRDRAKAMHEAGVGVRAIAAALGVGKDTIAKALR